MTKPLDELLHDELDGANSKTDSAELSSLCELNAEARRRFEELGRVETAFRSATEIAPPADFSASIMRRIGIGRQREHARAFPLRDWWSRVTNAPFRGSFVPVFGFGIAAGLAAFVVYDKLTEPTGFIPTQATGTFSSQSTHTKLFEEHIGIVELKGSVSAVYVGGGIRVTLTADEIGQELKFTAEAGGPLAIKGEGNPSGAVSSLSVTGQVVEARVTGAGEWRLDLMTAKKRPDLVLTISRADGAPIWRKVIPSRPQ